MNWFQRFLKNLGALFYLNDPPPHPSLPGTHKEPSSTSTAHDDLDSAVLPVDEAVSGILVEQNDVPAIDPVTPAPLIPDANKQADVTFDDLNMLTESISAAWVELPHLMDDASWASFRQEILEVFKSEIVDELSDFEEEVVVQRVIAILDKYPDAKRRIAQKYAVFAEEQRFTEAEDGTGTLSAEEMGGLEEAVPADREEKQDLQIPVFFATDRQLDTSQQLAKVFANRRGDGRLHYGLATVSIPLNHQVGVLETPNRWLFQKFDPKKHFTVLTLDLMSQTEFKDEVNDSYETDEREILIFIHGYQTSFQGGLRRTAQLAYDLNFDGIAMYYSWPSAVQILKYSADEATIEWSQDHFDQFLSFVMTDLGATKIHVIAHSMGNRLLSRAMKNLSLDGMPEDAAQLRQIVFTAPDVDASLFKQLATAFDGKADRYTLYASSRDFPLELSSLIHGGSRAGEADETDGGPVIVSPVETIDVSAIDSVLAGLGHSYFGGNVRVIQDMIDLIVREKGPDDRPGLTSIGSGDDGNYWRFLK